MSRFYNAVRMLFLDSSSLFDFILETYMWWIPDRIYLRFRFRLKLGWWPDLKNPKTFNEKLNWLKLYNRRPQYTTMVDKYAVKSLVASSVGKQYVIPTIGVWDSVEDIEWDKLPNQFVLKTTHGGGGGGVVVCKNKDSFNKAKAINVLTNSMNSDIYRNFREWPYKNVVKRIIAEQYLVPSKMKSSEDLQDFKFFCFNGKVKFFKIDFDRFVCHRANYYTPDGQLVDLGEEICPPKPDKDIKMPLTLPLMIELAEKLSKNEPFLRVDLYNVDEKIYFGELTFYPAAGMGAFTDPCWDLKLGKLLKI